MVNLENTIRLLALPTLWMGFIQVIFGVLSLTVFDDNLSTVFFETGLATMAAATVVLAFRRTASFRRISFRDALLFATLTWVVMGLLGALPIYFITGVNFSDAVFESVSGLTTTGSTILTGLDSMPKTFLMYRQFLNFMGGLGVVIFVVAVLPMLNVGGMRLLKAETPGPMKDDKLTPRVANTAHYLWYIYLLLTVLCALSFYFGGMSAFDAIGHSFAAVATGGFSTHDNSMGFFESHLLLAISNVFMLLGAFNFALHYVVLHGKSFKPYWRDDETRIFLLIVAYLGSALAIYLFIMGTYDSLGESFSYSFFTLISFITSTGFGAADLPKWPQPTILLLIFVAYLGGCAGSTAGGNKIVRNILTFKMMRLQFYRLVHPRGSFSIFYNGKAVEPSVREAVMGFMTLAALSSMVITLLLMATGLEFLEAISATAASLNLTGPGFGALAMNHQSVSDLGVWILSGAMILGRLEYFTVLALFSPLFWRY
jgi:trk system potassium uptake protein